MDALVLEGIYEDGRIELDHPPAGVKRARVRVTFLPEPEATGAEGREAARQRAFARMREGLDFGGQRFDRAALYEERIRELEMRQDRSR